MNNHSLCFRSQIKKKKVNSEVACSKQIEKTDDLTFFHMCKYNISNITYFDKCSSIFYDLEYRGCLLFSVNTKYNSSSELKKKNQNFLECAARVKIFMFSTHEMKYIWYSPKKKNPFYFIQYTGIFQFTRQAVKMQKPKIFENTNNFGTTLLRSN